MAVTLALPKLFADVSARVVAAVPGAVCVFGWREPQKHLTGAPAARLVFVPGDSSGSLGEDLPPRHVGRAPRPIATLGELFQVYVTAYDASAPENELAQYQAARVLFDEWRKAMHLAAHGTFEIQSARWNTDKSERRYGAEIIVTCSIQSMIPDDEDAALSDAHAAVEAESQGITVTFNAPAVAP
jgi:hypothetical protein